MTEQQARERVSNIIIQSTSFNGGAGLFVPPSLAKRLAEMGIKDGYIVSRQIPMTPEQNQDIWAYGEHLKKGKS